MSLLQNQTKEFKSRHIGPNAKHTEEMLQVIGINSLEELVTKTIPSNIKMEKVLDVPQPMSEHQYLEHIKSVSQRNQVFKTYIGQGYYGTHTPSVILRNIFENPGWYTQYTPYQAEISQGRLESLLNYQTMVCDLTGLEIANASLLDESTAAAEAMSMFFYNANKDSSNITKPKFFIDKNTFQQTINVVTTRATPIGAEIVVGDYATANIDASYFGALIQYPNSKGTVNEYKQFIENCHSHNALVAMCTDLMALTLLTSPSALGADVACGTSQRFGVPIGFGGPHAAFFATKDEFKRAIPGRIIGVSIDADGNRALRMALQTREQHIKREKATSNICTAQALLANMAAMYAVYHGPEGLKNIAKRINTLTQALAKSLIDANYNVVSDNYFDTITIQTEKAAAIYARAIDEKINLNLISENEISLSIDETTSLQDINKLASIFRSNPIKLADFYAIVPIDHQRTAYLQHPVFNTHHSESQMMRYIKSLENKDLSLNTSMISLGSCTMKLNAATEMMPLSWPEFSSIHPFAPSNQTQGYQFMIDELSKYLCEVTAFDACSLQPNSGAQGEYAGLLSIRSYHLSRGNANRNIIIIPISAHGTNPASAIMAGMQVVVVKALENGYIDVADLKEKVAIHSANLAGLMITYPSTYGVYEETVIEITDIIHANGGQVYMDGANMNAQVALTAPGLIGADVCHLNLHKTFAIPHGGGGPGVGPICVKAHLAPFLPGHITKTGETSLQNNAVSGTNYGSASILLISYAYIRMLGADGLKAATEYAILNANYMRARLTGAYEVLYLGKNGTCAHEFIVDLRPLKKTAGIEAEDVAKRLMDYGFHAPTLSFPVAGTIMIEPTESEDKAELDRFCDAMLSIRAEIGDIELGNVSMDSNLLKHAPHTQATLINSEWTRPYTREQAAFPLPYVRNGKFWPTISRVNNTYGDRNLVCSCEPIESYMEA
jgi:glycine dehydrogenase